MISAMHCIQYIERYIRYDAGLGHQEKLVKPIPSLITAMSKQYYTDPYPPRQGFFRSLFCLGPKAPRVVSEKHVIHKAPVQPTYYSAQLNTRPTKPVIYTSPAPTSKGGGGRPSKGRRRAGGGYSSTGYYGGYDGGGGGGGYSGDGGGGGCSGGDGGGGGGGGGGGC
ncbi:hypothetical protein M408DRAFT_101517 [Serendipita vermifera MAFF 305830]|uniref:Uncharacterized protein n=1 Tax=Serendipita vermifera MAFF 305830 TaxID=933852 RepID=A0A0C2WW96_SERVB|nr:hypothetical protein M408DRAFT_101517 [Serendipita vermifera MAFF 305830]